MATLLRTLSRIVCCSSGCDFGFGSHQMSVVAYILAMTDRSRDWLAVWESAGFRVYIGFEYSLGFRVHIRFV